MHSGYWRRTLPAMQTFRSAPVPLLLVLCACLPGTTLAAPVKTHTVTLGPARKVPYTPPYATHPQVAPESATGITTASASSEAPTLKIRALFVDAHQREWTTGDAHDVTDRSFTIRRALRINDALPADQSARWVWQPGPWLLVDRTTGHIAALHLPDFDPIVSDVAWFRDYAAYCGVATTVKGGLFAVVAQVAVRKPIVHKQIGPWPPPDHTADPCPPATWQRQPMRVTLQPIGSPALTFDVVGTTSLVEDTETEDP